MAGAGGIAIGGSNMWAALRNNDPGHRTDGVVIDRPKRKKAKKKTTTPSASVDSGGEMQTDVPGGTEPTDGLQEKESRTTVPDGGDEKETPAAPPRWGDEEASKYEEEEAEEEEAEFILVGGVRCRTVKAAVAGGITVGGTNTWDLLCDNGPGHSADVVDGRKHKKVAAVLVEVEETPPTASVAKKHETAPAAIVDDGSKVQINVPAEINQATTVPDGEEEVTDGGEEKETAAVSPSEEQEEVTNKPEEEAAEEEMSKEEEEFIDVVTTVARRTSTAAVAGGITVGGANMWAALRDDDPGHGAGRAKRAKRGKKTKKNKKRVAEDSEQADAVDDGVVQISNGHEEQETPADELPSKVEEEEEKTEGAGAVATGGSRCPAVASTICRAAIAAAIFALWCRFGPIAV